MNTNKGKLLLKDEVFQVVGCTIGVLDTLSHGLPEKSYENALAVGFGLGNIRFRQQPSLDVVCRGQKVDLFLPNLIVYSLCCGQKSH